MKNQVFISLEGEPVDLSLVWRDGEFFSASDLVNQYNSTRISVFNLSQWVKTKRIQEINEKTIRDTGSPAIKIKRGRSGFTLVNLRVFSELLTILDVEYNVEDLVSVSCTHDFDFYKKALFGHMIANGKTLSKTMKDINMIDRIISNMEEAKYGCFLFDNLEYSTALGKLRSHITGF